MRVLVIKKWDGYASDYVEGVFDIGDNDKDELYAEFEKHHGAGKLKEHSSAEICQLFIEYLRTMGFAECDCEEIGF